MSALCLIQTWFLYIGQNIANPLRIHIRIFHVSIFSHEIFKQYFFDRLSKLFQNHYCKNVLQLNKLHNHLQNHIPRTWPFCVCFEFQWSTLSAYLSLSYLYVSSKVLLIKPCGGLFKSEIWVCLELGPVGYLEFMYFLYFL